MSDTNEALTAFTAGDLVISVVGDGDGSGTYTDNQAAPIVLEEITTTGTVVGQMVLPQTPTVVNGVTENAISGEYGSSSEGSLQLSADGQSLVIMGYGVNAQTYNEGGAAVYGNAALAQSTSVPGGEYTAVPRVVADISYNGTVDTSTAIYNIDNTNNPRSVATANGTTFYISGQGVKGDNTQGVFTAQDGASSATAIDTSTDTRTVEIINGVLYVSRDSTQGAGGTSNIESYGTTLPTSATVGTPLSGIDGTITLTAAQENSVNASAVGTTIHLSPENYFFASSDVLYIADGGDPKEGGLGDGGLQKWVYSDSTWTLEYTLSDGLNLVTDTATSGTTGLIGLTGTVVGGVAYLYATNSTLGDLDQTYLYGITDTLSATTGAGESFTVLETAAPDTNIRGVSFAPSEAATTTSNTTVTSGTTQSSVQVTSGSFLDIQSGGTAIGATIFSGGSATVELGGVDSGSYIAQGGEETVLGSATGDSVDGFQLVSAGAVVSNEIILNGGTVELLQAGAIGNDLTVASGGFLVISGNATAESTVISGGSLELEAPDAVVSGTLAFESTGTIEVTANISSGDGVQAVISGFAAGDVIDLTSATTIGAAGGAAGLTTTTSGGDTIATVSGGGSSETFVFAGTTIAGNLALGSDGNGGEQITFSATLPSTITVSSGVTSTGIAVTSGSFLNVLSGGTAVSATINAGGAATIEAGGLDSGSVISVGGNELVLGSANLDQIYGTQLVSAAGAIVSNETVYNGGAINLFLKGGASDNITVDSGGSLNISGNASATNTVLNGGTLNLQSSKSVISGSVTFDGGGTLEFSTLISAGYGDFAVTSGFGAGDVIDETVIGSGATFSATLSGVDTIATITSGGVTETFTFAGLAPSNLAMVSDGNGGEEIVYSAVTPTETSVTSGSTQSNVSVTSGSTLDVLAGGTIVSAAILSGGSATVSTGGTDSGSMIAYGGNELVLGSANLDQIYGTQLVSASAAVVSNETIYSGGTAELFLAGVTADNLTVMSGGTIAINGRATASNTVLSGGSIILESSKATLSGSLTFDGPATLQETATVSVTSGGLYFGDMAVISGFGAGDVLDFTSATSVGAAGSAATVTSTTSGGDTIVTISGGGSTEAFIFAGTTIGASLTLVSDGHGGEEIVVSSSTSSSTTPPSTTIVVSSGVTSTGLTISNGSTLDVQSGGIAVSAAILAGGVGTIEAGGYDSGTFVSAGGSETVTGSATLDQIGGTQLIGGSVTSETILSGGSATVEIGAVDSGSTIQAGGNETVLGSATLDQIYGTQLVSASAAVVSNETIYSGGTAELFLAGVTADNLTVMSGGTIAINGRATASNTVLSGGSIILESSKATLSGSLTFDGPAALQETATVSVTSGGLYFGDMAIISGFGAGDVIDFTSATSVGAAGAVATATSTTSGGNTIVTVSGGGSTEAFIFAGTTIGASLTLGSDGHGGEELTETACFLPGTHILTDRGEVLVEKLQVGDRVVTASGQHRPLCWIGQGRALAIRGRRGPATPLIVRKGALADNVPHRDLRITKGHSLYLDDVLIPVEFLVNHRSIQWDDHAQEVTVYHLELDTHDVLVADGAPAESYRDDGNRWLFRNANTGWDQPAKAPCAPVLTGGAVVDAVWRRLLDRTGSTMRVPLTDEADLHLLVDGRRVDAAHCEGGAHVFSLAGRPDSVRIVSRAVVPQEVGLARDPRTLGVALRQIVVRQGARSWTIKADDARLASGFHQYERDNSFVWTDGDAALPMDLIRECSGTMEVVLTVASTTRYIDEGVRLQVA